jgi:deoxyadenosine/deoxycytidine kinase
LLLEQHEENPFLADFYKTAPLCVFNANVLLLSRYRQQQEIPQRDLFQQLLVADYLLPKTAFSLR